MMKIGNGLRIGVRIAMVALLLFPAVGCPRKHPIFTLSPQSLLFSLAQDVSPQDQTLTMTGIKEIPGRGATWTLETDQPWLTVTPNSGTIHANEAIDLTVNANQSFLPVAMYSGQIHIVAHYGRHTYPQTLDVTLDVTPGSSPPPIVNPEE